MRGVESHFVTYCNQLYSLRCLWATHNVSKVGINGSLNQTSDDCYWVKGAFCEVSANVSTAKTQVIPNAMLSAREVGSPVHPVGNIQSSVKTQRSEVMGRDRLCLSCPL